MRSTTEATRFDRVRRGAEAPDSVVLDHAWFRREGTLWQQGKVGERVGIRDQTAQFRPSYAITVDSGTDSSGRAPHGRGQDWCFINESNHETTGRMQVRRILFVFFSLSLSLSVAIVVMAIRLEWELGRVEEAQARRHESYLLADELRQSSDDLTRFARTYTVTGEKRYREYFEEVLAIREGTAGRPVGYHGIYWDLVISGDLQPPTRDASKALSLEDRMLKASFTVEEFSQLKRAQTLSNELVNLENVALNAVEGRFDDGTGAFSTKGEPDLELARQLLHGDRYHQAKARIMQPIDEFLSMVDQRTRTSLEDLNQDAYNLLIGIILCTLLLLLCLALLTWTVQRRLLRRTMSLVSTAHRIEEGDLESRSGITGADEVGKLGQAFDDMVGRLSLSIEQADQRAKQVELQRAELEREQQRSEELLHNILPEGIAKRLKSGESTIADTYSEVTVLFADIVGFTELSEKLGPRQIVSMLNDVFGRFDEITLRTGVEKIKTIGDSYMVVGGVPDRRTTHCQDVARFALEALESFRAYAGEFGKPLQIRLGMHTGTVVAGVVGTQKFVFDLWGDVVNVASRLESTGVPDRVQVSNAVQVRLTDDFLFEDRGDVELKGRSSVHTWFLTGQRHDGDGSS